MSITLLINQARFDRHFDLLKHEFQERPFELSFHQLYVLTSVVIA